MPFDLNGEIARSGHIVQDLIDELNTVDYFQKKYPKSLDNNWIRQYIFPILQKNSSITSDKLHTYTRFIAIQIKESIQRIFEQENLSHESKKYRMLATGGGAFNQFLIEQIQAE